MADNKKERILDALLELMKENHSLSAITVSLIAERAGIGKGTVYEYFSSKEEIFIETIGYFIQQNIGFMESIRPDMTFRQSFEMVYDNIGKSMKENRVLLENALPGSQGESLRGDFIRRLRQEQDRLMSNLLSALRGLNRKGVQEGILQTVCSDEDLIFAFLSIILFLGFGECLFVSSMKHPKEYCYQKFVCLLQT